MSQHPTSEIEYNKHLLKHQRLLLDEAKRWERETQLGSKKRKALIAHHKRQYNLLTDKIIREQRSPFTDPLEALPAELWIQIVANLINVFDVFQPETYSIDSLFILANVSQAWLKAAVTVPSLWTTVILDATDEDCFAKAATSIELSGMLSLDVVISVPPEAWRKMASRIIPHGKRFRSLTLLPFGDYEALSEQEPREMVDILLSFKELPILRHLNVVSSRMNPVLVDRRLPNRKFNSLVLNRMPSLQTVTDLPLHRNTLMHLRQSEIKHFVITELSSAMIETLVSFSDIQHLDLLLRTDSPRAVEPYILRVPVSSIRIHRLDPYPLGTIFPCLGLSLRKVTMIQLDMTKFFDTLSSLQQFKSLSYISLYLTQKRSHYDIPPNVSQPYYLPTITSLKLHFGARGQFDVAMWLVRWSNAIFDVLLNATPSIEHLTLVGDVPSNAFLHYIKTLDSLKRLVVKCDLNMFPDHPYPLAGQHLEHLKWAGNLPTQFFDHFDCPSLYKLALHGNSGDNRTIMRSMCSSTNFRVPTLICNVPLDVSSQVTSPSLTIGCPIYWELTSFPAVTQVALMDSIWIKHITIGDRFYEWDILLCMLERRNFATSPSVSRIKSISFRNELSLKLLYPISDLLRGKFLTNVRIADFSLRAIAKRIFDPAQTGCTHCCHVFRECTSLAIPYVPNGALEYEGLGWHYDLPSAFVTPSPELSPEVAGWIAGKRARRVAFMLKSEQANFRRLQDCARGTYRSRKTVTAYSEEFE